MHCFFSSASSHFNKIQCRIRSWLINRLFESRFQGHIKFAQKELEAELLREPEVPLISQERDTSFPADHAGIKTTTVTQAFLSQIVQNIFLNIQKYKHQKIDVQHPTELQALQNVLVCYCVGASLRRGLIFTVKLLQPLVFHCYDIGMISFNDKNDSGLQTKDSCKVYCQKQTEMKSLLLCADIV